jgi:hypothetical protein
MPFRMPSQEGFETKVVRCQNTHTEEEEEMVYRKTKSSQELCRRGKRHARNGRKARRSQEL